jgi:hypothetical protein
LPSATLAPSLQEIYGEIVEMWWRDVGGSGTIAPQVDIITDGEN